MAIIAIGAILEALIFSSSTNADEDFLGVFLAVVIVAAVACAYFLINVWPTPWRYERAGTQLVRVRRTTGAAEILTPNGWRPLSESPEPITF